jgi:serine/threonine-protein kinase haspin
MPPLRTYGKRKITGTTKASQIFGTASSSCPQTSSAARAPLSDLTNQLANLGIEDYEHVSLANASGSENRPPRRTHAALSVQERAGGRSADHSHISSTHGSSENPNGSDYIADNTQHQIQFLSQAVNPLLDLGEDFSDSRSQTSLSPDYIALQPLTDAYRVDCNQALPVSQWDDILPPGCEIVKIAEASFAEVYRISFDGNNSILKVMQLKVPSDPSSIHSYTAVDVQQVVSEVRLMNALTEFPGFVTYKGAHLIRGKPSNALIRAHDSCLRFNPATQSSHYPHPSTLNENSLVLAIELGDAGRVLDETPLRNINEVWDVLLGVVIALATAEQNFQFEVCLYFSPNKSSTVKKLTAPRFA